MAKPYQSALIDVLHHSYQQNSPAYHNAEGETHAAEQNSHFPQVHNHLLLPTEQVDNLNHCEAAYLRVEP